MVECDIIKGSIVHLKTGQSVIVEEMLWGGVWSGYEIIEGARVERVVFKNEIKEITDD